MRKFLQLLTICAAVIFAAGIPVHSQTIWTEYSGNPIFGEGATPAGPKAYYSNVVYDAGSFNGHGDLYPYKMWYGTSSGQTGLAYSNDGIVWADQGAVMANGYHAQVIYTASGFGGSAYYKMWYWGGLSYNPSDIRYTESIDGVNWTNDQPLQNGTVVPFISAPMAWNRGSYGPCTIFYNPTATNTGIDPFNYTYTMYYDGTSGGTESTGLAYSTDGITWNGYDADADGDADPVLQGTALAWDNNYAVGWTILKNASNDFEMWYSGGNGAMNHGIGYATSSDGINWIKDASNPIFYKDDGITWRDNRTYTPSVIKNGSNYKMWFTGKDITNGDYSVGYATGAPPLPPPTEVWVDDDYCDGCANDGHTWGYDAFATIQDGIDGVSESTVFIANGTYSETLIINKAITLTGASEAGVVINIPAAGGYGISITSSDVVLENFTLETNNSNLNYPIHASGTSNPPNGFDNLTIQNVTIQGIHKRTGFDIHGYNNVVLANLTSSDAWFGNGISLTGCINVTVQNCTTTGNAWGGIAVYVSRPTLLNRGSDNINIDLSNNSISEWLYVEDEYGLINTNIHIQNWTYVINNEYIAPTNNYFAYISSTLNDAVLFGNGLNAKFSNKLSTIYDPSLTNWYVGPDLSIQAAINAAASGDMINVAAGTYPEQLLITKALTINGSDGAVLDGTTLGSQIVGVKIKSGDVTFNNIDVAHFSGNGIIVGYEASTPGSLKNVHITNCKISGIQPGYSHGFGIYVGYQSEDFKRPATSPKLTAHLDYSGLLIENNEITDSKSSSVVLQSITGDPGTLMVRNNYIHDNYNDGIWIDCARNINIEDNTVTNNPDGIYISSYGDAYILGSSWLYNWEQDQLNGPFGPMDISITGNQIVDNKTYGGVYLQAGYPATISINGNSITGNIPEGVANYLNEQVNATCNWWGAADGPSGFGGGLGDAVSDNVTFLPWLIALDGSCAGGTPNFAKLGVREDLAALSPSGDKKTDDRIKKAIKAIDKSLDDKLWEDYSYLTKKGKKVFDEEKKAVKELGKIVKDKKEGLPKTEAQEAIVKLVDIDRSLAQLLIDKATTLGGDSKEIEKAEKEMEKAEEELADDHGDDGHGDDGDDGHGDDGHGGDGHGGDDGHGGGDGDDGHDYDKAIDHYKKAWEHAYKALEKKGLAKYNSPGTELSVTTTPEKFSLGNNYPNPFNPTTLISYNLPEASQVTLAVYDIMGRRVKTLVQEFQPAGNHSVMWNATNDIGTRMSGGMYFYQIKAGSFLQTHKMVLLK